MPEATENNVVENPLAAVVGAAPRTQKSANAMPFDVVEVSDDGDDGVIDPLESVPDPEGEEAATNEDGEKTDEEGTAGDDEPVLDEEAEEEDAAPTHLRDYRTSKGKLDEARIEAEIGHFKQRATSLDALEQIILRGSPEFRRATLKRFEEEGVTLAPEYRTRLLAGTEQKPAGPKYTVAEAQKICNEALASGKATPADVQAWWHTEMTLPEQNAAKAEIAAEKKRLADEKEANEKQAETQRFVAAVKGEFATLAKQYPSVVKEAPGTDFGFDIPNKKIFAEFCKVNTELGPKASRRAVLRLTLDNLGMLGKGSAKAKAPAVKPHIVKPKPKVDSRLWAPQFEVKA